MWKITQRLLCLDQQKAMAALVKNKYTQMYLKYIYFMLSMLQIHIYVLMYLI